MALSSSHSVIQLHQKWLPVLLIVSTVLFAIKTYKLQSFLDSRTVVPPQLILGGDGTLQENPEFARFEQQDSALASWFLSSATILDIPSSANVVTRQPAESINNSTATPAYCLPPMARGLGRSRSSCAHIQCQLCGKVGHLVNRCYHQFDTSYKSVGYRPPSTAQANVCTFWLRSPAPSWVPSPMPMFPSTVPSSQSGWCFQPGSVSTWPNPFVVPTSHHVSAPSSTSP
ncbi:hypothetical protein J1N35_038864 [Gossypium stocksii]|uniref:CCHC-type domain-containing protein n=1 Tax=Gossypium stocksii TaxID=47602 RepID=A0A9D3ZNA9_9ROSI|nr:hypothetical protein J1N35_038864 [Gossypium stocksii]